MNAFFKKLAHFIVRYHRPLTIASALLAVLSASLVLRIELKTDMLDVLPANNPEIARFKGFLEDFGSADNLVVVVEAAEGGVLEHADLVEELASRLGESGSVSYVDYNALSSAPGLLLKRFPLFLSPDSVEELEKRLSPEGMREQLEKNRDAILSPIASPAAMYVVSRDPLDIGSIVLKSLPARGSSAQGYYMDKDQSMLLIFVKPAKSARDMRFLEEFSAELSSIIGSVEREGVRVAVTGPYAFAMEAHASLKKEIVKNFALSSAVIIFLFQFVYRKRPLLLVLTALTLVFALAHTLAAAMALFGGLNMVSCVVIVMLMGMGIDYIIHVFNRWEEAYRATGDAGAAVEEAFARVLPGVAVGAATTSAAFFSILFTEFRGMYEFGIVAGIGVLFCLVTMVFFLCPAAVWLGPRVASRAPRDSGARAASIVLRRPAAFLAICAALLTVSALALPWLRFDSDPESIGKAGSPVIALEKKVSSAFGSGKNPLIAVAGADSEEGLMSSYGSLESALKALEKDSVIASYSSLNLFVPPPSRQEAAIASMGGPVDAAALKARFVRALKDNGFKAGEYQEAYIERVAEAYNNRSPITLGEIDAATGKKARLFYNPEGRKVAAYVFPRGSWDDGAIAAVSEAVGKVPGASITGAPVMLRTLKGALIRDISIASAITCVLITAIVYLQFRSLKWTIAVQGSLLSGVLLTIGAMAIFGVPFNYINIGAVALIFGIGIDYSVYVMQGYLEAVRSPAEGVARVWKSVVMCALTTMAGFGSLITMSFDGISSLGAVITIGVLASLVSSLVFLPALLAAVDRRRRDA